MNKDTVTTTDMISEEFEAPELTQIGEARDVVQGVPMSGWDYRGLSSPSFEFESDEEQR